MEHCSRGIRKLWVFVYLMATASNLIAYSRCVCVEAVALEPVACLPKTVPLPEHGRWGGRVHGLHQDLGRQVQRLLELHPRLPILPHDLHSLGSC